MFPTNMAGQRDRLVTALRHIVSNVDELVGFLQGLGADHRKFGVQAEHYPAVGEDLLATLQHFLSDRWTDELAADWAAAYALVAQVMSEAATAADQVSPPCWLGEVTAHERRAFDVAVLTLRTSYRPPYTPGQSIGTPATRAWRYYSPANAPARTAPSNCTCGPLRAAWSVPGSSTGPTSATRSIWPRRWGSGSPCATPGPVTCSCSPAAPAGRR